MVNNYNKEKNEIDNLKEELKKYTEEYELNSDERLLIKIDKLKDKIKNYDSNQKIIIWIMVNYYQNIMKQKQEIM